MQDSSDVETNDGTHHRQCWCFFRLRVPSPRFGVSARGVVSALYEPLAG